MSNLSTPFAFDVLLNKAPTQHSSYIASNGFVRNSGLYDVTVFSAQLLSYERDGVTSERIQIRAFAVNKEHPEHSGRAVFSIFVPNPNKPENSDYLYYSLCQVANVIEVKVAQNGTQYAAPNWQPQESTGYNNTPITELGALKDKSFIVGLRHTTTKRGIAVLNPDAVFTSDGYSAHEVLQQAQARGLAPVDITTFHYSYEGNALEPVQRSGGSSSNAAQSFAPQGYAAAAPQQPAQPAQSYAAATQAYPTQQQPQAPQYQGFTYAQQPVQQQQPAQQAAQPAQAFAAQQPQATPYANMQQGAQAVSPNQVIPTNNDDDKIPF